MNARKINDESLVDLMFHLKWKSEAAMHTDVFQASRVNVWRDYLPPFLLNALKGRQAGERIETPLQPGDLVPGVNDRQLFQVKRRQFGRHAAQNGPAEPAVGRFYPKGLLRDVPNVFSANVQPFRCVQVNNGHVTVDFNHPLSGKGFDLSTVIGKVGTNNIERGGSSVDWPDMLTTGPGMQARWQNRPSQFFSEDAFRREDEQDDSRFYEQPRLVQHIDDTAIEIVTGTYGRLLKDGMQVLDLMSSWQSHIPENVRLNRLAGLGLNEKELKKNPRLSEAVVQDLNRNDILPFETESFDAVVSTVSIEYLVDPLAVFEEVSRVLRTDGYFIVTFSNRWFSSKAVAIWKELHEFERMGLVLEIFLRSGAFKNLQTYSIRGLPRPHDDKYFPELWYSDPVYAVWGQKKP